MKRCRYHAMPQLKNINDIRYLLLTRSLRPANYDGSGCGGPHWTIPPADVGVRYGGLNRLNGSTLEASVWHYSSQTGKIANFWGAATSDPLAGSIRADERSGKLASRDCERRISPIIWSRAIHGICLRTQKDEADNSYTIKIAIFSFVAWTVQRMDAAPERRGRRGLVCAGGRGARSSPGSCGRSGCAASPCARCACRHRHGRA